MFLKKTLSMQHIFEEQLNSAQEHLEEASAIQNEKLVTSFKTDFCGFGHIY